MKTIRNSSSSASKTEFSAPQELIINNKKRNSFKQERKQLCFESIMTEEKVISREEFWRRFWLQRTGNDAEAI